MSRFQQHSHLNYFQYLILEKWNNLVDLVIDGGYGGNEASTIIDLSDESPKVVREGKGPLDIF